MIIPAKDWIKGALDRLGRPASIYIAGPMRGRERYNFDQFLNVASQLRSLPGSGDILCPAEWDLAKGFKADQPLGPQGFDLQGAMRQDLRAILDRADAILLLPEWRRSLGATLEFSVARAIGLDLLEVATLSPSCPHLLRLRVVSGGIADGMVSPKQDES